MVRQGFFSGSANKDERIASSLSSGGYGGYIDAGSRRGYVSPEQADKMLKNPEAYKMRPSETRYLRESMGLPKAEFFSPRGKEVARLASLNPLDNVQIAQAGASFTNEGRGITELRENENKTPQPLSPIGSKAYEKEVQGYIDDFKKNWNYRRDYDVDTGAPIRDFEPDPYRTEYFGEKEMRELYPHARDFRYEHNPLKYQQGVPFGKTEEKGNALQRIAGSIFNAVTGTQPAAAQPRTSTSSESGDTSFRSYRMGQDFADSIREIGNLPSDYKATEAAAFKKAADFRKQVAEDKKIEGIIDRNPRLTRGADGSVKAVQKTRSEAGPSARTAAGNRARVKANAKARAKAAAVNRRKKKNKKN